MLIKKIVKSVKERRFVDSVKTNVLERYVSKGQSPQKLLVEVIQNPDKHQMFSSQNAAMKALIKALRSDMVSAESVSEVEKLILEWRLSHDVAVMAYDYFAKNRDFISSNRIAPQVLGQEVRKESVFRKLEKALPLTRGHNNDILLEDLDLWAAGRVITRNPLVLLKVPQIRSYLARRRRADFIADIYSVDAADGEFSIKNTVIHNLETMDLGADDGVRAELLLNPLTAIDYVKKHANQSKVLSIGTRSESELFSIYAAGFNPDKVESIDLISYSPLIKSGDMHALPVEDNQFDVIIAGWVLAYSNNNELAASEIIRVAKPDSFVAIGCAYSPPDREDRPVTGTNLNPTRFSSVEDITDLFKGHIGQIYFYGAPDLIGDKSTGPKQITVVFQLKK
ncbi:class I SAM-dependent methyltransferase [Alphaproteobacteria bacterium LSUCC0719]